MRLVRRVCVPGPTESCAHIGEAVRLVRARDAVPHATVSVTA